MDREMLERHLALAERHVAEGQPRVDSQRRLVAELERDGHDITEARRMLTAFEETQQLHVEDRDRIRKELEGLSP
jgi:hypothetical protein